MQEISGIVVYYKMPLTSKIEGPLLNICFFGLVKIKHRHMTEKTQAFFFYEVKKSFHAYISNAYCLKSLALNSKCTKYELGPRYSI